MDVKKTKDQCVVQAIETEATTKTEQLIEQLGWHYQIHGDEWAIQTCPFCNNTNHKLYIHVGGDRDGCWDCKVCGQAGNYYQLRQKLGLSISNGLVSMKDTAQAKHKPGELPNFDLLSLRLHSEQYADALDYLACTRGLDPEIIKQYKLGVEDFDGQSWIIIPYYDAAGNPVFYKARSIPPAKKAFRGPAGREAPLFNSVTLKPDMEELLIVESEMGALTMLSQGYKSVVGVPGANVKKAIWIEQLDTLQPKVIYLLYDNDKPGQEGAKELAKRIGLDRVKNVLLPSFDFEGRPGKDVNEWFCSGRTMDELRELMLAAKQYDVAGVQSVADVLAELKHDLEDRGTTPKYSTPWPSLNKRLGGFENGDLVAILADSKIGKTTLVMNLLHYYANVEGHNCLSVCLEMQPKRSVRKWVSHVMQAADSPEASQVTADTVMRALEVARSMPGDLLFGYTKGKDPKEVFSIIHEAVRRYGVRIVAFDHLHLLCQSVEHQAQEVAKLAIDFKTLAMDLNILVILIVQPNRVAEGQIVSSRNTLGSSMVEKLVDCMVCLHRNRVANIKQADFRGFLETDDNLEPYMLARVDLCRYAAGGCCTLFMDGAKSTVRECVAEESVAPQRPIGIPTEINEI